MDYLSSDIDWCEQNFVYSDYIAEFYNTISNIPFIGFYYLGLYTFKHFHCQGDDKFLYGCLLFTGISSFYFHATLSLFSQLLDEFCIIFLLANTLIMIYKNKNIRFAIKGYTLTHSIVMCYYPFINIPVLFMIGFTVWKILRDKFKKYHDISFKKYWSLAQYFFILSVCCWLIDKFLCTYTHGIQFHALWHIFSAVCAYYSILVGIFLEHNQNNFYITTNPYYLPIIQKY
tara:strand:+ start:598 stop:1287 length:690 start_codon:yes stop_codon:yes gene_type:complete